MLVAIVGTGALVAVVGRERWSPSQRRCGSSGSRRATAALSRSRASGLMPVCGTLRGSGQTATHPVGKRAMTKPRLAEAVGAVVKVGNIYVKTLKLRSSYILTKSAVVRLRRESRPRETENGPKWAPGPVLVIRINGRKGPHFAGFRPEPRAGKRMSRVARLADQEEPRSNTLFPKPITYELHDFRWILLENFGAAVTVST